MALYISNAFSLGMLSNTNVILNVSELKDEEVKRLIADGFISCVGHQTTADLMSAVLGTKVPVNRVAISLNPNDTVIVMQLQSRLPEGKVLDSEEIKSIQYKWLLVEIVDPSTL